MLLKGKHDYVALDIKKYLLNSCTNIRFISLNTTVEIHDYDTFLLKKC